MNDFLNSFRNKDTNIEFLTINNGDVRIVSEEEATRIKNNNVYFLGGVRKDLEYSNGTRAKDEDIIKKNYFAIDLDLRNNFEKKYKETVSNEDIIREGMNIIENLSFLDEMFGEFSYTIFSGNGIHIYYMGDFTEFTKEEYSLGVSRIYKKWDEIWGDEVYFSDKACKNIARVLRLPGSINQKNGEEVKILHGELRKSRLFGFIKAFAKKEKQEQEERQKRREEEIKEQLKKFSSSDNEFYNKINSIPAYQIAQLLVPEFKLNKNEKNFDNNKGGLTGYYYVKETNTICNGGSRYFDWGGVESCWNNFSMIKHFKNFTDKEVFEFYKLILR